MITLEVTITKSSSRRRDAGRRIGCGPSSCPSRSSDTGPGNPGVEALLSPMDAALLEPRGSCSSLDALASLAKLPMRVGPGESGSGKGSPRGSLSIRRMVKGRPVLGRCMGAGGGA